MLGGHWFAEWALDSYLPKMHKQEQGQYLLELLEVTYEKADNICKVIRSFSGYLERFVRT